jgi:hypothetical protein
MQHLAPVISLVSLALVLGMPQYAFYARFMIWSDAIPCSVPVVTALSALFYLLPSPVPSPRVAVRGREHMSKAATPPIPVLIADQMARQGVTTSPSTEMPTITPTC